MMYYSASDTGLLDQEKEIMIKSRTQESNSSQAVLTYIIVRKILSTGHKLMWEYRAQHRDYFTLTFSLNVPDN